MTMKLTSSAFDAGQAIPAKYTCEGEDISPPLQWSGVPAGAKSLALICDMVLAVSDLEKVACIQ